MMSKLEMKRWVFEQLLTKLELAKTDQEFAGALAAINTVVHIDPEQVADVLGEVEDKLGDQVDTDKIWEKMYGKEMEGVKDAQSDTIPSIDEMQKQLEDEVAADLGSEKPSRARAKASEGEPSVKEEIGDARQRLKKLLEEDK
jgi:hypothetical protein